jgi:hypothetical protein
MYMAPYIYGAGQAYAGAMLNQQWVSSVSSTWSSLARVGQNHIYGAYTVLLAGRSPYIRSYTLHIYGSGQPYIYAVHIRYFWQGNHHIYGHIRCRYTVLANPVPCTLTSAPL